MQGVSRAGNPGVEKAAGNAALQQGVGHYSHGVLLSSSVNEPQPWF